MSSDGSESDFRMQWLPSISKLIAIASKLQAMASNVQKASCIRNVQDGPREGWVKVPNGHRKVGLLQN